MMCSLVFREKLQSTSVESLDTRFQQKQYMSTTLNLNEQYSKNSETIQKLETFTKGILNETMERHSFNKRKQKDEEKLDEFLTDIKVLSENCNQRYPLAEEIDWAAEKAQKGMSRLRKDKKGESTCIFFNRTNYQGPLTVPGKSPSRTTDN